MVRLGGEKMSKSLGNLVFVHRLLEEGHDPAAIRLALLVPALPRRLGVEGRDARRGRGPLERWRAAGAGDGALEAVRARLDDDLDTPAAIAAIDEEADAGRGVSEAAALLGVAL